ncbi:uncharacterized protein F5891DRAFT_1200078 [Suillus fuscotomentosus]|uniref:Uncharacterized protein n=1 Tax=Suillus fuscotomentosus TaxID=1912939 RepID=A0AAD4HB89_9AGAM|nr:uncharacterized protein F5891DRAFT_1200078 [Suillus fuscotomentosus]KAG1887412.1 hypothetical protein F5891DRAFT_1200078 [Suillus fuscotomentosus]
MSTDYSFSSPFQHDDPYFQQHQTPRFQNSSIPSGSSKAPNYSDHDHHSTDHHSWNDPSGSSSAYMHLNHRIQSLEYEIQCLKVENSSLSATHDTYEAAFNTLAASISSEVPAISSFTGLTINSDLKSKPSCTIPGMKSRLQPLDWKDYPKTRFWTEDMYTKWTKTPASQWVHENRAAFPFPFLEDTDGKLIVKAEVSNILKTLRNVWHMLLNNNCAPDTWGHAGTDVLDNVIDEMTRHHPVLALCSNGWKVQAIATEHYPSWASTHIKKRKKSSDAIAVSSGTKRKITKLSNTPSDSEPPADLSSPTPSNEPDHPAKQPKVDEASMTPLAAPDPTVSMTMATTLPTIPIASGHSLSKSGSEHVPDLMTLLATPDLTVSMTMGATLLTSPIASGHPLSKPRSKCVPDSMTLLATPNPIVSTTMATTLPTSLTDSGHPLSKPGSERVPDSITPLATPDPIVSTTMATTLLTSPTDSSHPPSESRSEHVPDSMTPAAPDLTVSHLPQIKNLLAKLMLSKKPNPSVSPVLAPSTNSDPGPTTPTELLMAPIAKDAILPTPGSVAGTMDNSSETMTTKKFRPTATKNGRNLCTHRWLKIIAPNGTSGDFKLYWNALSKDSQLNYEREAAAVTVT